MLLFTSLSSLLVIGTTSWLQARTTLESKIADQLVSVRTVADFLRSVPYFFSLEDTKINQLAAKAKFQSYGSGEFIVQQGLEDNGLYFIYMGKVRISTKTRQGDNRELNSMIRGDVFGELAIFAGEVSPITVVAEQATEVVLIPHEFVIKLIESIPKFGLEFSQFIEQRRKSVAFFQDINSESDRTATSNGKYNS